MIPYNKSLVDNAKELRKNMTPEERFEKAAYIRDKIKELRNQK